MALRALLLSILLACAGNAQSVPTTHSSAPATRPATPANQQRFLDLVAIIEQQNTIQARRTATMELLRQGWPETPRRLATILTSGAKPAKLAVMLGLAESREYLDEQLAEPVVNLLRDDDPELRAAAAQALATFGDPKTIEKLGALLMDDKQSNAARAAAIDALRRMTAQEAVAVLMRAVADPDFPLRPAALAAVQRATAQSFNGDYAAALDWWKSAATLDKAKWLELQISRLVHQNDAAARRMRDLETRLAALARESYLRVAEADRPAVLAAYLADPSDVVRLAGLDLLQTQLTDGKTASDDIAARARALIDSPEEAVRAAAIRTVTNFRAATDARRFVEMLATEPSREVRLALIYALGYVGDASAVAPLIAITTSDESDAADEAVVALGRLAERPNVLDGAEREAVANLLLARTSRKDDLAPASRRELLRAMTRLADPRFRQVFVSALAPDMPKDVRLQAIRGLAAITPASDTGASPASTAPAADRAATADALVPLAADADPAVRRLAIETLGPLARTDAQFQALLSRLSPAQESEESIRAADWKAVSTALVARQWSDAAGRIEKIPADFPDRTQHTIELLVEFEKSRVANGNANARGELGDIRMHLAAQRALAGKIGDAVQSYLAAIDDLLAAKSPEAARAATELFRLALLNNRYSDAVAVALAPSHTGVELPALWSAVKSDVESRLRGESKGETLEALKALRSKPPAPLPNDMAGEIDALTRSAAATTQPRP